MWMGKESIQEQTQLLATLLEESRFKITEEFLLWETWSAILRFNALLDEILKISQTWVSVFDVETDVFGC